MWLRPCPIEGLLPKIPSSRFIRFLLRKLFLEFRDLVLLSWRLPFVSPSCPPPPCPLAPLSPYTMLHNFMFSIQLFDSLWVKRRPFSLKIQASYFPSQVALSTMKSRYRLGTKGSIMLRNAAKERRDESTSFYQINSVLWLGSFLPVSRIPLCPLSMSPFIYITRIFSSGT